MTDPRSAPAAEPASAPRPAAVGGRPDRLRRGVPAPARAADAGHAQGRPGRHEGRPPERQAGPVSVEFTDYRDYSLGDDLRTLDWNIYARLEKLFIKLFIEEEDVTVHILLDASGSMGSGIARTSSCSPSGRRPRWPTSAWPRTTGSASPCSRAAWRGATRRSAAPNRIFQVLADLSPRPGRARADRSGCLRPPLRGADHAARPAAS